MAKSLDYQAIFAATPNPYMVVDRELRYVAANAAYLSVTQSRLEDLLGRRVIDVFPNDPDDPNNDSRTRLRSSLERVIQTGRPDFLPLIPYRIDENLEMFHRNGFEIAETFFQWYNFAGFLCVKRPATTGRPPR